MEPQIISVLITGVITLLVCMINSYFQMRKVREESSKTIALMDYKLTELTKKVDKHNNLVERTYHLEETAALHEERFKVANHRIEDLERDMP